MTTETQARNAIYDEFVTKWGTTSAFTFDNEHFDPPEDAAWVRLAVRHNFSNQETLGPTNGRKFLRGGIISMQVFVPVDTGQATTDTLVGSARTFLEGVRVGGVTIRDAVMTEIGPDGDFFQTNLDADFEYDVTK